MLKNPRAIATRLLLQVIGAHHSLTTTLGSASLQHTQANLVKELCFGVCRWYFRLTTLLDLLLAKPLRAKDQDIQVLLLIGLYQLLYLRIPEHAAVQETVAAAKALKKPWAAQLTNGVLRTFLRQRDTLLLSVDHTLIGRYAHPKWLTDEIYAAWPMQGEAILTANNRHPPLCLRINRLKINRTDYLHQLTTQGITAHPLASLAETIIVETPQDITQLPGYQAGHFFVQDSSAQLAAGLLELGRANAS